MRRFDEEGVAAAARLLLEASGLDMQDPLLQGTPRRMAHAFREFFSGVWEDELVPLRRGDAVPDGTGLVALKDLEFRSVCAHHLLPFSGLLHVIYEPVQRVVGIGSIARTVAILTARPQLQEALAQQLAHAIVEGAEAAGCLIVIEARHACIADRGPRERTSRLVTTASAGALMDRSRRTEALLALRCDPALG